jgi:2-polyprenyl-3-methyl-5-hydroxy-6-metoxy-1,4-benzoquinol methylase
VVSEWTNDDAIGRWNRTADRADLEATAGEGDFAKRHLVNPVVLRMLGDLRDRRVLDAGSGNGYLSRMLAQRGARVVGVEPTDTMCEFARE